MSMTTAPRARRVFAAAAAVAGLLTLAAQLPDGGSSPAPAAAPASAGHHHAVGEPARTTVAPPPLDPRTVPVAFVAGPQRSGAKGDAPLDVCLVLGRPEKERTVKLPPAAAERLYRATRSYPGPCADYGPSKRLGDGTVRIYSQLAGDRPVSLGFVLDRRALGGLPTEPTDGAHCYDVDGNGTIDPATECVHEHEYLLDLPQRFRDVVGGPFQWAMLNWDPRGHAPAEIYGTPHFDLHFYLQDRAETAAIGTGPCGGGNLVDCADYAEARLPVPARYLPADYLDIDAVVPGMGNHLGDPTAPEFNGQPFTHTFMYGAYGGDITFYEPMITRAWLADLAAGRVEPSCRPLKLPAAWKEAGWYPTSYCMSYRANRQEITVSLTDFVSRPAS